MTHPVGADRKLAHLLARIEARLERLESGQRAAQLGHSTLHNSRIMIRDGGGAVRGWLGRQPDGTFGLGAANGDPPPQPNTPTMSPIMSGLGVGWNGEFVSARPADFSHLLVYVSDAGPLFIPGSSNLVGTLVRAGTLPVGPLPSGVEHWARFVAVNTSGVESTPSNVASGTPAQVVAQAVLDGIVAELALADDAVTAAKIAAAAVTETAISDGAVTSPKVVAEAIQAVHLAVDSVAAGRIAADAVTTRELAALAVTAGEIAANAINAGHIQAGVIDAEKLAAEIVLASRVVLGDPVGARLEIDAAGFAQFSAEGDPTTRFGADPQGGNYLTIVDPTDPQTALASISDEGVVSASGFAVSGGLMYQGDELSDLLSPRPRGVAAIGAIVGASNSTTSAVGVGWFESEFNADPGRVYRLTFGPIRVEIGNSNNNALDRVAIIVRRTLDGSRPTLSSDIIGLTHLLNFNAGTLTGVLDGFTAPSTRVRTLVVVASNAGGKSVLAEAPAGLNTRFTIEDIGAQRPFTGGLVDGGGSDPPPPARQTRQWPATWTRLFGQTGSGVTDDMIQGRYFSGGPDNHSMIGFDDANIRSALAGATINAISVRLTAYHWYFNSGGRAIIGVHNTANPPSSYNRTGVGQADVHMAKPETKWIGLPTSVGNAFRDNTVKGLVLDSDHLGTGLTFYGRFRPAGHSDRPILSITYTK